MFRCSVLKCFAVAVAVITCTVTLLIVSIMHRTHPTVRFRIHTHFIDFQGDKTVKNNLKSKTDYIPTLELYLRMLQNKQQIPDPWDSVPTLELFLRMTHKHHEIYDRIFKPSLLLFWPQQIRLMVILDKESQKDHQIGEIMGKKPPYPKVYYEEPHPYIYNNRGNMRMQWSTFYPENYTKAEYVGYVDTDTLFVTVVTPEDLFRDGKPIIIVDGQLQNGNRAAKTQNNPGIFKEGEIVKCMPSFPAIFKVTHIMKCRHYLEKLHNKSFDAIIHNASAHGIFSQFSIMCQYIYKNHHDEYIWRIHVRPNRNFEKNLPGRVPLYKENFKAIERSPIARTTMHWKYQTVPMKKLLKHPYNRDTYYPQALMQGLCYSGGFDMCSRHCRFFNRSAIHRDLFNFGFTDWAWHPGCTEAQRKHYADVSRLMNFYKSQGRPAFGEKNATIACERVSKMLRWDPNIKI